MNRLVFGAIATRTLIAALLCLAWSATCLAAPAADCARAASDLERLICVNNDLTQLDQSESAWYSAMLRVVSAPGGRALLKRQRAWLKEREACLTGLNGGDTNLQIACLKEFYRQPSTSLLAWFRHAGTLTLEERETVRHIARWRVTETDSHPWLAGAPGSQVAAFNQYVSHRLALGRSMFSVAPVQLEKPPGGDTEYHRFYEIHYMDSRLISIEVFTHHESYFGHGWHSEFALNWDLKNGGPIRIADLFRSGKDWRQAVRDAVLAWLKDDGSFDKPEEIAALCEPDDNEGWLFGDDGAVLLCGRGERSMVGASADVPLSYAALRPYLQPDAPLPAR
jgi:uncharacterized protein YecT (DUF1311 family)